MWENIYKYIKIMEYDDEDELLLNVTIGDNIAQNGSQDAMLSRTTLHPSWYVTNVLIVI